MKEIPLHPARFPPDGCLYDVLFTNRATIMIVVGYGEIGGVALSSRSTGESKFCLVTNITTASGVADMTAANYAAMGGNTGLPTDGAIGLSSAGTLNFSSIKTASSGRYDAITVTEHEISGIRW